MTYQRPRPGLLTTMTGHTAKGRPAVAVGDALTRRLARNDLLGGSLPAELDTPPDQAHGQEGVAAEGEQQSDDEAPLTPSLLDIA
jgi:hypothetical protein